MNTNTKIEMKIDNLISMLERVPADKEIMVPKETIDLLEKLSKGEELPEVVCPTESEEEESDEDSDDEESEDGDWDGDLDYTPNCHECGEDCGRSIIAHQKYKKTYFCSEECNRKYDGEDE